MFGLFDVACQHFPLLVVTEKRHVLLQQYQLDFGFVVGTGQGGYLLFKFGLMYFGLYSSSLVEGLRQVDVIVL